MNFDKSKVFTALNADEVKVGSKGIFSDNLALLKLYVTARNSKNYEEKLKEIKSDVNTNRFIDNRGVDFSLFYLVEEPAEEKYRPYEDTDELIEDWKERASAYGSSYFSKNPMFCPSIWVKGSGSSICKHLITDFICNSVETNDYVLTLEELFEGFTYLDGTPCGKKNLKEKKQ